MYVSIFWMAKYERKLCLIWMVNLQVLAHSQLIFPSKTWFFGIFLNFQQQKSLKNQYLSHSKSKSYQIPLNLAHQGLHNTTKAHSNSSKKFQLWFNLIFIENFIQYFKKIAPQVQTSWNQAHAPLFIESFLSKETKNAI